MLNITELLTQLDKLNHHAAGCPELEISGLAVRVREGDKP